MDAIQSTIDEYLRLNRDPASSDQIQNYVRNNDTAMLQNLFGSRLEFGTAGLRAEMGPGYSRMNQLTIIQTTQGVLAYLIKNFVDLADRGVVIGRDHRHNSDQFARLTAAVFIHHGIKVYYYPEIVHTPLVPFGVTHFKAACGIMITASHNPKKDNGYKLYWENGCQIIPPHDAQITRHILENLEPAIWDLHMVDNSKLVMDPKDAIDAYFKQISELKQSNLKNEVSKVRFCYTPMHGVGLNYAKRIFKIFGLQPFVPVPEQMQPDPDFPTVKFPNPEEKDALALAFKCAAENNCKVVFANDPDADRLAIAEYQQDSDEWYTFTGNEIGIILASFIIASFGGGNLDKSLVLTTTVSSHMLQEMAAHYGIKFEETLTGFKWIGNRAIELEKDGFTPIFAFEEAIGFMCYGVVKDKDGVSALAISAENINHLYASKCTIYSHLLSLYRKFGYWVSNNGYFICNDKKVIDKIFDKIRFSSDSPKVDNSSSQLKFPSKIGGIDIISIRDLTIGYDSTTSDKRPTLPVSSSSHMITFKTSGTEPKIKYYTELKGSGLQEATTSLQVVVDAMISELLEPKLNKLVAQ